MANDVITRLFTVALAFAFAASAGTARGDSAQNTGNCVVIIQGSGNSATLNGCEPLPVFPAEPQIYHVWQTPNLGIRFEQSGRWVPMFPTRVGSRIVVDLAPKPFIIWVPEDHWTDPANDLPALMISVSWDPALLSLSSPDLFSPGTGVAASMRGDGRLFMTDPRGQVRAHNYIIGHRFDRKMPQYRGLFVSLIDVGQSAPMNLISPGSQGFMVFLMEEDDMPSMPGYHNKQNIRPEDAPRDNLVLKFEALP